MEHHFCNDQLFDNVKFDDLMPKLTWQYLKETNNKHIVPISIIKQRDQHIYITQIQYALVKYDNNGSQSALMLPRKKERTKDYQTNPRKEITKITNSSMCFENFVAIVIQYMGGTKHI